MSTFPRHLIDLDNLSDEHLLNIIDMASRISNNPDHYSSAARGKIMATLFYEPSTRTQMSFQTAMLRLGGKIIGFSDPSNSSVSKGESLKDTVRVVSGYSDIVVIRHPLEGSAYAASLYSKAHVINAGDGGHMHPTQTLADLVTLSCRKRLNNLCIGLCGDLLNGRTVHSLIKTMCRFEGNSFVLISTKELAVPEYVRQIMRDSGCAFREVYTIDEVIGELDVLYMTRIQQERFSSVEEYEAQKGVYVLDGEKLAKAKSDLCILHPLPRVDEITCEVDDDPRACYFEQTEYGMYARMALILMMLKDASREALMPAMRKGGTLCANPKCITNHEHYLPLYREGLHCGYCDHE